MQDYAVDEREDRRIGSNGETKRKNSDGGEGGGFYQLTKGESEILDHELLVVFPFRCRLGFFWIQDCFGGLRLTLDALFNGSAIL